jgi:hypothetical protein
MAPASYPRAAAMAALQAALSGTWIAAADLTPARRRLTRAGAVAVIGAIGYAVSPSRAERPSDGPVSLRLIAPESEHSLGIAAPDLSSPVAKPPAGPEPVTFDRRKAAVTAAVMGLSVAAFAGRRVVETRWRARLAAAGHPHPTRALAVRMAGVEFAVQLALQVTDARRTGRKPFAR